MVSVLIFLLEILLTSLLVWWLHSASRGEKIPSSFIAELLVAGAIAALIAGVFELNYGLHSEAIRRIAPQLAAAHPTALLGLNYTVVAVIEEVAKYCAALFLITRSRSLGRLSDAIFYMVVIGLGFSLIEDALFLLNPNIDAPYRLFSFYLHSGTSAVLGYGFARFTFKLWKYPQLLASLVTAVILHLAYNVFTSLNNHILGFMLSLSLTVVVSILVFILYRRTVLLEFHLERISKPPRRHRLLNIED